MDTLAELLADALEDEYHLLLVSFEILRVFGVNSTLQGLNLVDLEHKLNDYDSKW